MDPDMTGEFRTHSLNGPTSTSSNDSKFVSIVFATPGSNDVSFVRPLLQFAVFLDRQAAVPILRKLCLPLIASFEFHAILLWFWFA